MALRALARQAGLPAFSTPALLAVLANTNRITSDEHRQARHALIAGRVGDAPLEDTLILEIAPADRTGVLRILGVAVADDEKSYAYAYDRDLSRLGVIQGVQ